MKKLIIALVGIATVALMGWAFYQGVYVAPNDGAQGEAARILYYHVPHGAVCYLFFSINVIASLVYLAQRRKNHAIAESADAWALAGAEVGVVYCSIVLVTGPIWGRFAWGIWWTWDARLTTTLVLWLIYVSYLLVRRLSSGSDTRTLGAVLAIFGAIDMPINYLSNRLWRTQHPAPVFGGDPENGLKDPQMHAAFLWNLLAWAVWGLVVLAIRVYVERRQQKIEGAEAQAALAAD
jgi:heme exporter protein C